jgi:plasmid stability protein
MNAITIRTISDRAIARIEELAVLHRRTVEEEAADIIEQALLSRVSREAPLESAVKTREICEERVRIADAIAAMTPKGVGQTDSTLLIREDRDRLSSLSTLRSR